MTVHVVDGIIALYQQSECTVVSLDTQLRIALFAPMYVAQIGRPIQRDGFHPFCDSNNTNADILNAAHIKTAQNTSIEVGMVLDQYDPRPCFPSKRQTGKLIPLLNQSGTH